MNLYIVRHGQTDWNVKNVLQGSSDVDLNSTGIEQAKITSEALKDINFFKIYCSPLKRTVDTATHINTYHNLELSTDSRIIERGFGDFEGTVNLLKDISPYWDYNLNLDCNNIEPIRVFFNRIYDFLFEIYQKYKDTDHNILVVTHGGVCIGINSIINDITNDLLSFNMKNCEFKVFKNLKLTKKEI